MKTKVKSSEFRFKPVKGWLGGEYTEKLEGWRARVFEVSNAEPEMMPALTLISTLPPTFRLPQASQST